MGASIGASRRPSRVLYQNDGATPGSSAVVILRPHQTRRATAAVDSSVGLVLFSCDGGDIVLPDARLLLVSRLDGGNLVVNPPRRVWERSALTPPELTRWAALVAAAGRAMLETLPQLEGGCINYWE